MPDTQIHPTGDEAAPADYVIPPSAELLLKNAYAKFDGSSAVGDFKPLLRIKSDAGSTVVEAVSDTIIVAGESADASWFPRVGGGGGIQEIESLNGSITVFNPDGPITNIAVNPVVLPRGHFQSGLTGLGDGTEIATAVTVIDYDPQGMCSGVGANFVTIPQHGVWVLAGTASGFQMPNGASLHGAFKNTTGPGLFPVLVESAFCGIAGNLALGASLPCLTSLAVCTLDAGDTVGFFVGVSGAPLHTAFTECVFSLTRIGL